MSQRHLIATYSRLLPVKLGFQPAQQEFLPRPDTFMIQTDHGLEQGFPDITGPSMPPWFHDYWMPTRGPVEWVKARVTMLPGMEFWANRHMRQWLETLLPAVRNSAVREVLMQDKADALKFFIESYPFVEAPHLQRDYIAAMGQLSEGCAWDYLDALSLFLVTQINRADVDMSVKVQAVFAMLWMDFLTGNLWNRNMLEGICVTTLAGNLKMLLLDYFTARGYLDSDSVPRLRLLLQAQPGVVWTNRGVVLATETALIPAVTAFNNSQGKYLIDVKGMVQSQEFLNRFPVCLSCNIKVSGIAVEWVTVSPRKYVKDRLLEFCDRYPQLALAYADISPGFGFLFRTQVKATMFLNQMGHMHALADAARSVFLARGYTVYGKAEYLTFKDALGELVQDWLAWASRDIEVGDNFSALPQPEGMQLKVACQKHVKAEEYLDPDRREQALSLTVELEIYETKLRWNYVLTRTGETVLSVVKIPGARGAA